MLSLFSAPTACTSRPPYQRQLDRYLNHKHLLCSHNGLCSKQLQSPRVLFQTAGRRFESGRAYYINRRLPTGYGWWPFSSCLRTGGALPKWSLSPHYRRFSLGQPNCCKSPDRRCGPSQRRSSIAGTSFLDKAAASFR